MADSADYRVDLSIYNGPLDLLLYLIRERELDIHDIPIAEITEQFLSHIEVVKRIDVDRAGDFLLMAATLMLIKSRMLLPAPHEEDEFDEELDPRTDLVRQLLEYKQFKDAAGALEESENERDRRYGGRLEGAPPEELDAGKVLSDIGADDLLLAFERMMRETLADMDHHVAREVLPMREVEAQILQLLLDGGRAIAFRELFCERRDRLYIVSVFLCLLEMLKARKIDVDGGCDALDLEIRLRAAGEAVPKRLP